MTRYAQWSRKCQMEKAHEQRVVLIGQCQHTLGIQAGPWKFRIPCMKGPKTSNSVLRFSPAPLHFAHGMHPASTGDFFMPRVLHSSVCHYAGHATRGANKIGCTSFFEPVRSAPESLWRWQRCQWHMHDDSICST